MGENGISAFIKRIDDLEPAPPGDISCALGGNGVLTTYIQEVKFYCGRDVAILRAKVDLTKQEILFYCLCIKKNRFRFNYGRQANKTLSSIKIPRVDEIPEWVYTADLNKFDGVNEPLTPKTPQPIKPKNWMEFNYCDLFDIRKGKRLTKSQMSFGDTPFIGSIDGNNGYRQYIDTPPNHDGGTITVNYNGSVAEAFYQPDPFWASDDVNVLYPKFELNSYVGLFLCSLIKKEKFRFNYGRKWHLDRMKKSVIRLPVAENKLPDWEFMENYIKSLPYSKSI